MPSLLVQWQVELCHFLCGPGGSASISQIVEATIGLASVSYLEFSKVHKRPSNMARGFCG